MLFLSRNKYSKSPAELLVFQKRNNYNLNSSGPLKGPELIILFTSFIFNYLQWLNGNKSSLSPLAY